MNKSAIQKYAIWARKELRNQITQKAYRYEITPDEKPKRGLESVNGVMLSPAEKKQRDQLVDLVNRKGSNPKEGFDQMVEEVAYTWFNRLIALRFMEVNDYLPDHIRVLSSKDNKFKPEIISMALSLDEKHFNRELILKLLDESKEEELYRYLLLAACNALNEILPVMFEKMDDYTQLLLPSNLLKVDSVIGRLISDIDEADWRVTDDTDEEGGQVQIIGWLYQYYNSELKDQTFADLKKNKKISKERIPAATQLFTPDWIVRYMVENSLGRLWLEGHPDEELKRNWKYYLDEAEQEPEVETQLVEIRKEYAALKPEDLSVADIAMGSGHILVYAFDVLMQIYRSQGIRDRDAVKSILEKNLYGLDIDDRATQLAYFAIMMKAREYDRRILSRDIQPNLFAIQESNGISQETVDYFAGGDEKLKKDLTSLISKTKKAKDYGSLIKIPQLDFVRMEKRLHEIQEKFDPFLMEELDLIRSLINSGKILSSPMWVYCMNPPYMGRGSMNEYLQSFLTEYYPDSKFDLFSAFMERALNSINKNGFLSVITMQSWMFLSSFKEIRSKLLKSVTINNLLHLENMVIGIAFGTSATTFRNSFMRNYKGDYSEILFKDLTKGIPRDFPFKSNRYGSPKQSQFLILPDNVLAYWLDESITNTFSFKRISDFGQTKQGLATGSNDDFLRFWFEIPFNNIGFGVADRVEAQSSQKKWFPCNKGGKYRKWYGNFNYVVNWENDGYSIRNFKNSSGKLRSRPQNIEFYFKEGLTWSTLSSGNFGMRYSPVGSIFETKGSMFFSYDQDKLLYILGLYNSKIGINFLKVLCPTMDFHEGPVSNVPLILNQEKLPLITKLVKRAINISKDDWNSLETSWSFSFHPLLPNTYQNNKISSIYAIWEEKLKSRYTELTKIEEELDIEFDKIYGNIGKLPFSRGPLTLLNQDLKRDIVSLMSYAVGVFFGRYAIDKEGVIPNEQIDQLKTSIDPDNIIPIGEDEYFEDDLTAMFIEWIRSVYGDNTLEENLQFIANGLGGKGSSRQVIRNYFINDFFTDHCKTYKKRPIYWLFDSGKKNGFKCLIYMHRYQADTLARIRTDYVLEQQERYRSQIKHLKDTIDSVPKSEQVKMKKQLKDLEAKSAEVAVFEEKIHHLADQMIDIDLDDGVKHNYALFQDVLAKIK